VDALEAHSIFQKHGVNLPAAPEHFMSDQPGQSSVVAIAPSTVPQVAPMYFPVSVVKLAVMSLCTFGIYELYWFYKNWSAIQERGEPEIMPFGRAFFAPFFCYSLFSKIRATAKSRAIQDPVPAGPLAAGWIIFTILGRLPDPYWLVSMLSIAFLLPVQEAVNEINATASPEHDPNRTFTRWNVAAIVAGGLFLALILVAEFLPPK
jgi:hypothetical protein